MLHELSGDDSDRQATVWCEPGPHLLLDDVKKKNHRQRQQQQQRVKKQQLLHLPPPPAAAAEDGLQYTARLISMVHVRDVFGRAGPFTQQHVFALKLKGLTEEGNTCFSSVV